MICQVAVFWQPDFWQPDFWQTELFLNPFIFRSAAIVLCQVKLGTLLCYASASGACTTTLFCLSIRSPRRANRQTAQKFLLWQPKAAKGVGEVSI